MLPARNPTPTRILFICMGNICRSPTAEGIFRARIRERGIARLFEHDSAGTGDWHTGHPPDPRAQAACKQSGYDIADLRGRAVRVEDFHRFDHIIAMDSDNLRHLQRMAPPGTATKLSRLLDHAPDCGVQDVPDPYYGGTEGFQKVLGLIEAGIDGLLRKLG